MDFTDCIKFANETPVCYLATLDGDQPRVRALGFWFSDKTGFYFQTGSVKDLYHQLKENNKVEACFWQRNEESTGIMMRVSGEVEFIDIPELKRKVLEDRPFLKEFGLTVDHPELIIFRIARGKVYFWTMETNFEPKFYIKFG